MQSQNVGQLRRRCPETLLCSKGTTALYPLCSFSAIVVSDLGSRLRWRSSRRRDPQGISGDKEGFRQRAHRSARDPRFLSGLRMFGAGNTNKETDDKQGQTTPCKCVVVDEAEKGGSERMTEGRTWTKE